MNKALIIVRSATVGMQIRDALRSKGIFARIVRVPREYTDGSCTQAVEILSSEQVAAERILHNEHIFDFRIQN